MARFGPSGKQTPERDKLLADAEKSRREFGAAVSKLSGAKVSYFDRAPEVPQHLLDSCKLIQNRKDLVKLLPAGGIVAEIGTDTGAFAKHIYETATPRELHIFEIDVSRIVPENLEKARAAGAVRLHEGDSAALMDAMPDEFFDWIYIDGDHAYEGVKRDLLASAAKLKPGGHLVFNDYTTWSPASMSRCGVARAVNEFCIANNWEFVYFAFQSMMYNDVAIRQAG